MDLRVYGHDYGLKQAEDYQELKFQLHRYLIAQIELDHMTPLEMPRQVLVDYVRD